MKNIEVKIVGLESKVRRKVFNNESSMNTWVNSLNSNLVVREPFKDEKSECKFDKVVEIY